MQHTPIGILGGTFDPVHLGHLHLATAVLRQCTLAKVIFIPCNQSPLRLKPLANNEARLDMLKLAIEKYPQFVVDSRELQSNALSYTLHTLQALRIEYGNASLCLIMGLDAFARLNEWYHWQELLDFVHIVVATRPDAPAIENNLILELVRKHSVHTPLALQTATHGCIYFVDINPLPIAATCIRLAIKQNRDVSSLLPPKVWQYIQIKGLYL